MRRMDEMGAEITAQMETSRALIVAAREAVAAVPPVTKEPLP